MKKILNVPIALLLVLYAMVAFPTSVLAIADPDTIPQVSAVYVYEDLLEDDDVGILIDYYLDYDFTVPITGTPVPDETVTEAYLVAFIDTDGTTQLKAIAPYTFINSGYGRGLAWIYFTAAEVSTYSINSANQTDYKIWLVGNPTLDWDGDPPKTIAGIDYWQTTGDATVLLALRVLYYADTLELAWSLDMVEATALGNRLTTVGTSYFTNVIANLRTMAPACFATGTVEPILEDIDYNVYFGGTSINGTAIISGSPLTLTSGNNTIITLSTGNFTIDLAPGTYGTVSDNIGTISSSPSDIVPGENEITVTSSGNITIFVALVSAQQTATDTVEGTGFDLTEVASRFGMSRLMFSGLLWLGLTIILCAAPYMWSRKEGIAMSGAATGGLTMLIFAISLIGGALLGLLDMRVIAMLAIGYGAFIGYMIFFRTSADIGRTVMFMGWIWFIVCLMGGLLAGIVPQASTRLTADITATDTTITVSSTANFREQGIIIIGDERMAYHHTTATEFTGTFWRPLIRGSQDTDAAAHFTSDAVRSTENALLNDSLNYNIALLSDASGLMQFVALPLVVWDIITSFILLPLSFLGTDMVLLTYIWGIIGLGLLISVFIALAGGRRV